MPALNISKSILVEVSPDVAYDSVRNFRDWPTWSPWIIADAGCQVDFAEDGNSYSWDGEVIGSGSLAVKEENRPSTLELDLTFLKPWKSQADVRFEFAEEGEGTRISWIMDSSLPIFLFFLKKMMVAGIGMDYERGLLMLKAFLETGSVPSQVEVSEASVPAVQLAGITTTCSIDEIGPSMDANLSKLKDWLETSQVEPSGKPRSIYHCWDVVKREAKYTVGFPVSESELDLPEGIVLHSFPDMSTFSVTHTGAYHHLGNAWSTGMMYERAKKISFQKGQHPFEIYETMPGTVSDNEAVTTVHFPVKGG